MKIDKNKIGSIGGTKLWASWKKNGEILNGCTVLKEGQTIWEYEKENGVEILDLQVGADF